MDQGAFWEQWKQAGESVHALHTNGNRYCLLFNCRLFIKKTDQLYVGADSAKAQLLEDIDKGLVQFVRHHSGYDEPTTIPSIKAHHPALRLVR